MKTVFLFFIAVSPMLFISYASDASDELKPATPNIYDLLVLGKFKDAKAVSDDPELTQALNELLTLNTTVTGTYEKDIGKKITLPIQGRQETGTLVKIKNSSLYLKLQRGHGTIVIPVSVSKLPLDDRMDRGKISDTARNLCVAARFFRQKNYQGAKLFLGKMEKYADQLLKALDRQSHYFLPLLAASLDEDIPKMDTLIKKGANIDGFISAMTIDKKKKQYIRRTSPLLIEVIKAEKMKAAKHLVEAGANVNTQTSDGVSPLMFAIIHAKDTSLVELLLEHKADIDHKDREGNTPLSGAVAMQKKDIVELLIDNDADLNEATSKGFTPIMISIMVNNSDIFKLLLAKGADINKPHPNGWTVFNLDRSVMLPEIRRTLNSLEPPKKKRPQQTGILPGVNVKRR